MYGTYNIKKLTTDFQHNIWNGLWKSMSVPYIKNTLLLGDMAKNETGKLSFHTDDSRICFAVWWTQKSMFMTFCTVGCVSWLSFAENQNGQALFS